ncbi:Activating signal cointegrator 1 complex subunit 1 [Amphibalanus amphitrite]|uniref:Activating signal cointegrator 1 complex subunit 1 n=1 Tax=Amphibalanus amphitrite TaxID=1232801 RepID=A0A6A4WKT8_AMPAM|nr:Activating signal cointegrator 1 complex subunit 1 [Amphibalanus amphitrite]
MKKPITVSGSSEEDVQLACELLKTGLTPSKQARPLLTHFVSVRLTEEPLRRRFEEFRTLVRDLQPDHDLLPDRLFQRPEKLHISLAMLQLPDEAALQAARDVLDICCRQLCDQPPVRFRLRGLGTFGTATRSRVLYSRPEPAECLQSAAELVYNRLSEAGLTGRQQESSTLHATLLNTTFLTRGAAGRRWRKFRGFDHGPLVEKLGEFDFGEVQPAAFEISSLTEKAADGYYAAAGLGHLRVNKLPQLDSCLSSGVGVGELRPAGGELQTDVEESRTDVVESRTDKVEPRTDVGEAPTDAVEPETDIGELQEGELGTGVEESRSDADKSRTDLGESRTGDVDFQEASAATSEESDLGVTVETTVVESPATPLGDMSRLAGLTLSGNHGASHPTPSDPEPLSHVVDSGSKDGAATEPP